VAHRFLLDTNIVSHVMRHPQGVVAEQIEAIGERQVCTSIVVAAELRYGAARLGSARLSRQLESLLSALDVLAYDEPADRQYADLRTYLERGGTTIGPNDMLIAAHALALDLTVVTANVNEFGRVPNLHVENWLDGNESSGGRAAAI
jgi:tRNA(fMet)-specific endonuclease VapC